MSDLVFRASKIRNRVDKSKRKASLPGFEPGTFGLEVQRAIHCATGTVMHNIAFVLIVEIHLTMFE